MATWVLALLGSALVSLGLQGGLAIIGWAGREFDLVVAFLVCIPTLPLMFFGMLGAGFVLAPPLIILAKAVGRFELRQVEAAWFGDVFGDPHRSNSKLISWLYGGVAVLNLGLVWYFRDFIVGFWPSILPLL